MEWQDLREVCDRYGIEVTYVPDEEQYRFYNWQGTAPFVRVYGYMPVERLSVISSEDLEKIVVEFSLAAIEGL